MFVGTAENLLGKEQFPNLHRISIPGLRLKSHDLLIRQNSKCQSYGPMQRPE